MFLYNKRHAFVKGKQSVIKFITNKSHIILCAKLQNLVNNEFEIHLYMYYVYTRKKLIRT